MDLENNIMKISKNDTMNLDNFYIKKEDCLDKGVCTQKFVLKIIATNSHNLYDLGLEVFIDIIFVYFPHYIEIHPGQTRFINLFDRAHNFFVKQDDDD